MHQDWPASHPPISSPPARDDAAWLATARPLNLNVLAQSEGARKIVAALLPIVVAEEAKARGNQRKAAGLAKLEAALGAVVGGLLLAWAKGLPSFRSLQVSGLTSPAASGRQMRAALDGLTAGGFVTRLAGVRYALPLDGGALSLGMAARMWPAAPLLALASSQGVTPATVARDLKLIAATKPRPVRDAVVTAPMKAPGRKRSGAAALPVNLAKDAAAREIKAGVESFNAFASTFSVQGCDPPQWRRSFGPSWTLGGRWIALANGINYQTLPSDPSKGQALRWNVVAIDGSGVVEIDVRGSLLTIMHGLLGLPLPPGNSLYAGLLGVPEAVAKAWVVGALGKGSAVVKWAPKALREAKPLNDGSTLADYDAREVGRAVVERFPFMQAPAEAVKVAAGLVDLERIGPARTLLVHRLMGIEAAAITTAMETLRAAGILAMPVHDSILIRGSYEQEGVEALQAAFNVHAGIVPRLKVASPGRRAHHVAGERMAAE